MNTYAIFLKSIASPLLISLLLLVPLASHAQPQTRSVAGTIQETFLHAQPVMPKGIIGTADERISGDLKGTGILHVYSGEYLDSSHSQLINVISFRKFNTADGELFFSEVGSRVGTNIHVDSTLVGGTGKYKNATGTLKLDGKNDGADTNTFTYIGTITTSP